MSGRATGTEASESRRVDRRHGVDLCIIYNLCMANELVYDI